MICNILRRTLTELKKGACDADLVASRKIFGSKLPAADQIVKITFYQLVSEKNKYVKVSSLGQGTMGIVQQMTSLIAK